MSHVRVTRLAAPPRQNRGLEHHVGPYPARIPVCVFAKLPVAGRVKTRLACEIGNEEAAELASAMLDDVWSVVTNTPEALAVLAAAEPGDFNLNVPADRVWLQDGADLGVRIESILQRGLELAAAAIAVGADSPLLTSQDLAQAIEQLKSVDAVLGPCSDGGFYLLGMSSCRPGALAAIPWSCKFTCEATASSLSANGMRVARIRTCSDVDTLEDVRRLRRALDCLPGQVAPRTRKWLDDFRW